MSSFTPPSYRVRRRSAELSNVPVFRLFSTIPPRVLGHAVVVVLCLTVAYAGRVSTLGSTGGNWLVQRGMFQPSAFAFMSGSSSDTLVRPPMVSTLDGTPQRLQIMHYETQSGDTINSLADRFDISANTILWANHLSPDQQLTPGQQLVILPVSGVMYTTQSGDTLETIARHFESDAGAIAQFNQLNASSPVPAGAQLVIPGGRLEDTVRPDLSSRSVTRPDPVTGISVSTNPPPLLSSTTTTPPSSSASTGSSADRVPFTARTEAPKPLAPLTYYVTAGDTLSSIAQRFGVSPESIAAASNLQGRGDSLSINQKLLIPPVPGVIHVVQDGDTLQALAQRYSADPNQIARANGLKDPFILQVGQTLVIPGGKLPEVSPSTSATSQTTYTVTEGDSVSSIADSFGVDLGTIVNANGLSEPYVLQPGQQLIIPGARQASTSSSRASTPAQPHTSYTVQQGDSLSQIADSFGVSLDAIVNVNNLRDPSNLQPGQQLVIPGATHAVVQSKPAPAPVVRAPVPAPRPVAVAPPPPRPSGNAGWNIVAIASKYLGAPYAWGATGPYSFDCSGFVWYVYRRAGNPIPRDMWGQLQSGTRISRANLLPGDIVFFVNTYEPGLSHDGIYIGGGRFINAVDYGIGVAVRSLSDPYWSSRYFGATRPW